MKPKSQLLRLLSFLRLMSNYDSHQQLDISPRRYDFPLSCHLVTTERVNDETTTVSKLYLNKLLCYQNNTNKNFGYCSPKTLTKRNESGIQINVYCLFRCLDTQSVYIKEKTCHVLDCKRIMDEAFVTSFNFYAKAVTQRVIYINTCIS